MSTPDFKTQILKCLKSPEDFKNNTKPVREELVNQNKETIEIFLDTVSSVIADKNADAISRFFALYFLKVTTERSNPLLIGQLFLRTEFLKLLEEYAAFEKDKTFPERGSNFFSSQPKEIERTTGSNFIALLLEMIKYWNIKYGTTDKGKDSIAREMYRKLSEIQKLPFPVNFFYYKNSQQTGDISLKTSQKQPQQQSQIDSVPNQEGSKQQVSKLPPGKEVKGDDVRIIIESRIAAVKSLKNDLRAIYEENKDGADVEALNYFYEEIGTANKELSEKMDYLLNNESRENEDLLNNIIQQTEQMTALSAEFQKYSSKKVNWLEHKSAILVVLRGDEKAVTPGNIIPGEQGTQKDNQGKGISDELKMAGQLATTFGQVQSESIRSSTGTKKSVTLEEEKQSNKGSSLQITKTTSQYVPAKEAEKKFGANESQETQEKPTNQKIQESVNKSNLLSRISPTNDVEASDKRKLKSLDVIKENEEIESLVLHDKSKEEEKNSKSLKSIDKEAGQNAEKQSTTQIGARTIQQPLGEKNINQKEVKETKATLKVETGQPNQPMKENQNNSGTEMAGADIDKRIKRDSIPTGSVKSAETNEKQISSLSSVPKNSPTQEQEKRLSVRVKHERTDTKMNLSAVETPLKERGQSRDARGTVSAFKLDQSSIIDRFASELKIMEQSIRAARGRSSDMDHIKAGITQSFLRRNRKPPVYQELLDKSVLKHLEEQLDKMKKEKQALSESQIQGFVTPVKVSKEESENNVKNDKADPRTHEKVKQLEKQCQEYQKNMELLRKKNEELASKLELTKVEYSKKTKEEIQKVEQEQQKFKQDKLELLERIKKLEEKLKDSDQMVSNENIVETNGQNKKEKERPRDELATEKEKQNTNPNEKVPLSEIEKSASLEPRYHIGQIFHRTGRLSKNERIFNAPQTLKKDSSEGEFSNIKIFQSFEEPSDTIVHYNRLERAKEPIFANRPDVLLQDKDANFQPRRAKNHRKLRIVKKQVVPQLNYNTAIFIQDSTEPFFERSDKQNNFLFLQPSSPTTRKTEAIIGDDRMRRTEAKQRISARSSTQPSARQLRAGERSFSPPLYTTDEERNTIFYPNQLYYKENNISESEPEYEDWQVNREQVLGEVYVLKEMKSRFQTAGSLNEFKLSCLKPKCMLLETDVLQIGIATSIYKQLTNPANYLQIMVYYGNKLNEDITEFRVSYSQGINLNVKAKPERVQSVINSNRQLNQQLTVSFNQVPFGCLQLSCEGLFGGSYNCFSFYLPTVITKFMDFKQFEPNEYRRKWKRLEKKAMKTESISVNPSILSSSNDFYKYFSRLVDLRVQTEGELVHISKETILGGIFELDVPFTEYLMNISYLPQNNTATFHIASEKRDDPIVRYLLQTLIFLFKR